MLATIKSCHTKIRIYAEKIPLCAISLAARLSLFMVFWKSVQTKINGLTVLDQHFAFWNVTDTAVLLFRFEYGLPLLDPRLAAYLATFGEFFLSLMLLAGLFTRFAAFGLLVMTLVIQIFVYPSAWATHLMWSVGLLLLLRNGADPLSVDRLIKSR